jgi:hypothetical protein
MGFFSGFFPVDAILSNPPTWQLQINNSLPIFYYCSAPGSCIGTYALNPRRILPVNNHEGSQMVGVINPNASVSIQVQSQDAKDSQYMLQPGENFPSEASSSSSEYAATGTSKSTSTSSTEYATSSAAASKSSSSSLSSGAIAGIVVAAVLLLILAAALFFFVGRARTLKETVNQQALYPSVASIGGASSARGGQLSPASPPMGTAMAEPMYQAGGTVYIPVKATDLQRVSLPAYAAEQPQNQGQGQSQFEYGSPPSMQHLQQHRYVQRR